MKKINTLLSIGSILLLPFTTHAQTGRDTLTGNLTLSQCINYALRNQPLVRQATIDEQINERDIQISLSAWLPQIGTSANYQHYFQRAAVAQSGVGTGTGTNTGTGNGGSGTGTTGGAQSVVAAATNVSTLGAQANQVIYNNDVLQASRAARFSRLYYKQNTQLTQVDVVSDVSKAFYDVLLSQRQLEIIKQDITRLQRSLKDAYARYQAGVVDKTDYKQATIALNNSMSTRKQLEEAIKGRTAYLKQVMGVMPERPISLAFDSTRYEREAFIDTNQVLNVSNRLEYRQLETQKNLQNLNVSYYKWGFLPSLSAFGSYNLLYFNDKFSNLYQNAYPNSLAGLTLTLPIFQGGKRIQNLRKARLQVERVDYDLINTRNAISTEYTQALANYKSNYTNWLFLKQNVDLAQDVYNVVSLQYREGVKTYLDVIVAQSDLRTAQLNYFNALFQVLSSKIDLQRALGNLNVNAQ